APLDLRRALRGARARDARGLQRVRHARRERRVGAHEREIYVPLLRRVRDGGGVRVLDHDVVLREAEDARVLVGHRGEERRARAHEGFRHGVLARAATHQQHARHSFASLRRSVAETRCSSVTPTSANAFVAPASRSTTVTTFATFKPASRSTFTASRLLPPLVVTSSTTTTSIPGSNTPSSCDAVPCPLGFLRTMMNGMPDASDAAAARGTAPSSMPAMRAAPFARAPKPSPIKRSTCGSVLARL